MKQAIIIAVAVVLVVVGMTWAICWASTAQARSNNLREDHLGMLCITQGGQWVHHTECMR